MQDQHFFLGLDSAANLAIVEYTHPYVEYRNPVTYALQREFEQPRFALRELGSTHPSNTVAGAAEQVRSKIFQIARQNLDCTLTVDTNGVDQPVNELFHHLPVRAGIVPVTVTEGSGEVRVGDQLRIARHDLLEELKKLLESKRLRIPPGTDVETSCAVALAVWSALQHEKRGPKAGGQEQADGASTKVSGWGKVRLL